MPPINRILIANRGEIACRIIRTARSLGIKTVAVYSDADAEAPHMRLADQAVRIGPAPAGASYLAPENILTAARDSGADAIHPGYGFLSENAGFAQSVIDQGLSFIGPDPLAIDLMGDKAKAKRRMIEAGVPCVPGYQGEDQSDERLLREAVAIGYPLMVKAAAGGGGRGMRLVENESDLPAALKTARAEALNAFGADDLIVEKAIIEPRHVEIQVFADRHGNVIHLGERDCSVQRRHQKVLEEAPCPVMTPGLRAKMGEAAVRAAREINYVGAGTVEFLLDANGDFYFLEMNTRLQVEHPVTELVTGLDLVALQIRAAQGQPLGIAQDDVALTGAAIEARLYAEDPAKGFLPATGPVRLWRPAQGDGVRIDAGIASGGAVTPYYDPMIAKVIGTGADREEARRRLIKALKETAVFGLTTNRAFLIDALEKPKFVDGQATTAFIAESFDDAALTQPAIDETAAACGALFLFSKAHRAALTRAKGGMAAALNGWTSASAVFTPYAFADGDLEITVDVRMAGRTRYQVRMNGKTTDAVLEMTDEHTAVVTLGDCRIPILFGYPDEDASGAVVDLSIDGRNFTLTNRHGVMASATQSTGADAITAPMHGLLLELFAQNGQKVEKGQRLAILEAMKMQHELTAPHDGVVHDLSLEAGVQIEADTLVMRIKSPESEDQ